MGSYFFIAVVELKVKLCHFFLYFRKRYYYVANMSEEKTVGQYSYELSQKEDKHNSIELQEDIHKGSNSKKSYEEEIYEAYRRAVCDDSIKDPFYIVVLFKRERMLKNVVRQLFFYRQTCPTPEYDQTVYRCVSGEDKIEFIWTVPNNSTCMYLPTIKNELTLDQLELLTFIEKFNNGDLDKKCAELNNTDKSKVSI